MESSEATNQLLKKKYDLHKAPEVESAARRTQARTGEKLPQDPLLRIQNYLNRFHEIVDQDDPARKEHALDLIKGRFHNKSVIKPSEIPENYWENQKRLVREQGHGDIEISKEMRKQLAEVVIADQESSLDKWIDYLSSSDAPYSDSLKYFTLRSIINMAEYDKEKKEYPQRSKGTTKPFPDLNREALSYVLDAVEKKYKGQSNDNPEFEKLLQGENFARLYAWAIEKVTPASQEQLLATKGEWKKYDQGSDHMLLVESLQGHGTGWCTAGESTAETQLKSGDFYVYYSLDKDGKPTIPRAAIRMEGNKIVEVRGIVKEQNLDAGAVSIVEEKLKEFPDGNAYQKRVSDMRRLTAIENQIKEQQSLTAEDLVFLYEINSPIEGFGFEKDPRIGELRSQRNLAEDMPVVFECDKSQIAQSVGEINKNTKAYVGVLTPGIFDVVQKYNIEHVYTSFPEGKIKRETISIGGKTSKDLQKELKEETINVYDYAKNMMNSKDFTTLKKPENINTVRLKVQDLGLKGTPTTNEIYARVKELGLDLCPAEVGPHYRLLYKEQPINEYVYIAMKQIAAHDGSPFVFRLARLDAGVWLLAAWANPVSKWAPESGMVFTLRK